MKHFALFFIVMGTGHCIQAMDAESTYQKFYAMAPQKPTPMDLTDTPHLISSDFVASPPPLSLSPASEPIDPPAIPDFATIVATILVQEHRLPQQNAESNQTIPKQQKACPEPSRRAKKSAQRCRLQEKRKDDEEQQAKRREQKRINAKAARKRKKDKLAALITERDKLAHDNKKMETTMGELQQFNAYLKTVLTIHGIPHES